MTFSLVARCADTGMFGMVISSSSPAVAARCSFAQAGVGAVATQNITNPLIGSQVLSLLEQNKGAESALAEIQNSHQYMEYRQVLVIDNSGTTAIHSGEKTLGTWGQAQAENCASGGNLLANDQVPQAMVDRFIATSGHLGDRLIATLEAGLQAGGEAGPVHSAGMLLVDKVDFPVADLRCDWSDECPIAELKKIWEIYKPQLADYVQRALDPSLAPSYQVLGDE